MHSLNKTHKVKKNNPERQENGPSEKIDHDLLYFSLLAFLSFTLNSNSPQTQVSTRLVLIHILLVMKVIKGCPCSVPNARVNDLKLQLTQLPFRGSVFHLTNFVTFGQLHSQTLSFCLSTHAEVTLIMLMFPMRGKVSERSHHEKTAELRSNCRSNCTRSVFL